LRLQAERLLCSVDRDSLVVLPFLC